MRILSMDSKVAEGIGFVLKAKNQQRIGRISPMEHGVKYQILIHWHFVPLTKRIDLIKV